MSLQDIRGLLTNAFQKPATVGPIVYDGLLEPLIFPQEIKSNQEKVLATLWNRGESAYHNILLQTGLDVEKVDTVLDALLDNGTIKSAFGKDNKHQDCFSIVEKVAFDPNVRAF